MSDLEFFRQQTVNGFHVVTDGSERKAWTMEGLRRVAGGGGASIAKQFGGYQEELGSIEGLIRANQPFVSMKSRHVVRWQQHHIVFCGIQMAISAIDDVRLRQSDSTLRFEIGEDEFVLFTLVFVVSRVCFRFLGDQRLCRQQQQKNELFHGSSYTSFRYIT